MVNIADVQAATSVQNIESPFSYDTIYKYQLKEEEVKNLISEETIEKIQTMLEADRLKSVIDFAWSPPIWWGGFRTDIEWVWKTERGTLPKRIASWHSKSGYKISKEAISKIGNIIANQTIIPQTYYFDITNNLNWEKGDFGDHRSCYFNEGGPKSRVKQMMSSGSVSAIRFFKPVPTVCGFNLKSSYYEKNKETYVGISRAWMYNASVKKNVKAASVTEEDEFKAISNGYGLKTDQIARVISSFFNLPMKTVPVNNSGALSINDSTVYVIAPSDTLKRVTYFNIDEHCKNLDMTLREEDPDNRFAPRGYHGDDLNDPDEDDDDF